ncbi:MAG: phenylalanine--tRNA ligase subunit alpha [Candidatus Eisenbacteria bacterium]|nr:phenylalanine--tRNA ligase subunit alpha [Candidatus Eisenbacteria bacterium]
MEKFSHEQYVILKALASLEDEIGIGDLSAQLGVDQALVAAGAHLLAERGLLEIRELPLQELILRDGGRAAVTEGLPERRVLAALLDAGTPLTMQQLPERSGLTTREVGSSLRHLQHKGWARKAGATLEARVPESPPPTADEQLLSTLAEREGGRAFEGQLREAGVPVAEGLKLLKGRRELLEQRAKRRRLVRLSETGRALLARGIEEAREVGQITPEILAAGEWREVLFKAYDVHLGVRARIPGKGHPMQRVIAQTRRAFLEMGFTEAISPSVESAFWNFDALFQPQDHPAREMQDTFYLSAPPGVALPRDDGLVERVRRTHEDGGETGSIGWQRPWSAQRAAAAVLRTHTTATTVRALAADPHPPRKIFSIGRVFRREAIDFKHLPVFHQVDGIIIDRAATFANLLGTLAAFYRKMGFERFEFRPAFFPYTEPSVEVFIWVPEKKDWFEMGGAGIFRPEVTQPLGCASPVLAWGLGLERLAMLRYDLLDMRALYLTDLEWLKEVPLCR